MTDVLTAMSKQECCDALRHAQYGVGRICFDDGKLTILPVNFVLDGTGIVLRTAEGSKLDAALAGRTVAFETDSLSIRRSGSRAHGWSVLVRGTATVVRGHEEVAYLQLARLEPSAGGLKPYFVRIRIDDISGRRF